MLTCRSWSQPAKERFVKEPLSDRHIQTFETDECRQPLMDNVQHIRQLHFEPSEKEIRLSREAFSPILTLINRIEVLEFNSLDQFQLYKPLLITASIDDSAPFNSVKRIAFPSDDMDMEDATDYFRLWNRLQQSITHLD
jgi:hypothetical protein